MQGVDRPKTPQATFDRVAPYYDAFNSFLSLGIDRTWRRRAARELDLFDRRPRVRDARGRRRRAPPAGPRRRRHLDRDRPAASKIARPIDRARGEVPPRPR